MRELGVTYTQQERHEIEKFRVQSLHEDMMRLRDEDPSRYDAIMAEIVSDPS